MGSLRSILLHLDASPRSARRLVVANDLAAQFGARVTALYASTPNALSLPAVMAQGAGEMLAMLQQLDIDHRDEAKALFNRTASTLSHPMTWNELSDGLVIPGFADRALYADLLVLGQYDATDPMAVGVPSDFIASVLLTSGRPALILPYVDTAWTRVGQEVLVAWKPARESAHALSAAIAFLQGARRIHLAIADDSGADAMQARVLEDYLRSHEVRAPIQHHPAVSSGMAGEALLSLAADVQADLLVMGCYGHSRARELVLGGASRTVLKSMTLPVLMAH